jgi:predicted aminopeptidase
MIEKLIKKWKNMKLLKKIATILILCILVLLIGNCRLISYGLQQGAGQIRIVRNTRSIAEMMKDPLVSDSLKQKFKLVEEIKKFAIDSLGLNPSKNYNTFYDQKGKPILWIAVGCEAYQMKAYTWKFPIVGRVPYKGYFNKEDAINEAQKLKNQGYDSRVGTVSAWSTLGFFKDPILSDMLDDSEGQIARLIIHELTHSTLYVKGDAQFSENLATFIGDEGAKFYMQQKYGINSAQYKEYIGELSDVEKFSAHILKGSNQLDSLYHSFPPDLAEDSKKEQKFKLIQQIMNNLDTITFYIPSKFPKLQNPNSLPNNAFFIGYITYHKDQNFFLDEFQIKFKSDFLLYLQYLKTHYNSV